MLMLVGWAILLTALLKWWVEWRNDSRYRLPAGWCAAQALAWFLFAVDRGQAGDWWVWIFLYGLLCAFDLSDAKQRWLRQHRNFM